MEKIKYNTNRVTN